MLTKHHGLGNDFLIAVEPSCELTPEHARRWCDRRRGVGADGFILARSRGDESDAWDMTLWNADGSQAELSGNGLRCLGQAVLLQRDDRGGSKTFTIHTDGGIRVLEVDADRETDTYQVTVDMGHAGPGPAVSERWPSLGLDVKRQLGVDIGNPHLVVFLDSAAGVDLASVGPLVESDYPLGLNIELIEVVDRNSIDLRVWERGVGITEACGSGACAAAWASNQWGLTDGSVEVRMPGGSALVEVETDSILLTGPATFVAVVEIETSV